MTAPLLMGVSGTVSLQATLSASSSGMSDMLHHPIACANSWLKYHEDGSLECEHHKAPADDLRTRACVDHTIALLLMEEAFRRFDDGSLALVR